MFTIDPAADKPEVKTETLFGTDTPQDRVVKME